ncbi:retrovirus-related pol polyprotein from transposon TNT 1-94 [Tanacetum coccineum]|uniref:Retrovirus-related pol polyprotein from transposon TNT 1-94 n=1 Tax=Tanacetum coccineum TaxID=301880 RepID=A0ABQ5B516_9ASTR
MKGDGTIDKYIARLVIKGFRQREGLDYFDTYSSVTRITLIRMILAIAALKNFKVHQMDVKTAFLNGDLKEEIYMNQPEGFIAPGQESKVCRLVKSLYGLNNDKMIKSTKDMLKSKFDMKDIGTRPELAYAVSRLCSRDYGLHYDRYIAVIEGYSDANWISDIKDSRSTSGYVFTLGVAAIVLEALQAN